MSNDFFVQKTLSMQRVAYALKFSDFSRICANMEVCACTEAILRPAHANITKVCGAWRNFNLLACFAMAEFTLDSVTGRLRHGSRPLRQ